jgi:hypothetical protein
MSHRIRARVPEKTPIERIFEKVMRRSMTSQERVYLHLQPKRLKALRLSASKQSRAA